MSHSAKNPISPAEIDALLQDFRKVADEQMNDLNCTPELRQRILYSCLNSERLSSQQPQKPLFRRYLRPFLGTAAAAAAVVLIAVVGLFGGNKSATPQDSNQGLTTEIAADSGENDYADGSMPNRNETSSRPNEIEESESALEDEALFEESFGDLPAEEESPHIVGSIYPPANNESGDTDGSSSAEQPSSDMPEDAPVDDSFRDNAHDDMSDGTDAGSGSNDSVDTVNPPVSEEEPPLSEEEPVEDDMESDDMPESSDEEAEVPEEAVPPRSEAELAALAALSYDLAEVTVLSVNSHAVNTVDGTMLTDAQTVLSDSSSISSVMDIGSIMGNWFVYTVAEAQVLNSYCDMLSGSISLIVPNNILLSTGSTVYLLVGDSPSLAVGSVSVHLPELSLIAVVTDSEFDQVLTLMCNS